MLGEPDTLLELLNHFIPIRVEDFEEVDNGDSHQAQVESEPDAIELHVIVVSKQVHSWQKDNVYRKYSVESVFLFLHNNQVDVGKLVKYIQRQAKRENEFKVLLRFSLYCRVCSH